jgi:hypothetical protein
VLASATRSGSRLLEYEAHVARATVLVRTEGLPARAAIEAEIAMAQTIGEQTDLRIMLPRMNEVRAELAAAEGDEPTRARELGEAHRLYTEMGATGHAERVARMLSA